MLARFCRFYGVSPLDVMEMDAEMYNELEQSIDIIEAREMLIVMRSNDFPHLQNSQRSKLHKEISKRAYPAMFSAKKAMTWDDLRRSLSG